MGAEVDCMRRVPGSRLLPRLPPVSSRDAGPARRCWLKGIAYDVDASYGMAIGRTQAAPDGTQRRGRACAIAAREHGNGSTTVIRHPQVIERNALAIDFWLSEAAFTAARVHVKSGDRRTAFGRDLEAIHVGAA